MIHGRDPRPRQRQRGGEPRPNPASTGRRLKRNVRVGGRRTTIVLEAYVWDSIDSMLDNEAVSLDEFCAHVDYARQHSSMASSVRLVVLTYFRLLEQINRPPFVDPDLQRLRHEGLLRAPQQSGPAIPLLQLAIRRFAQDEAHAG
jgi:predicted DNA-binding ribbon-helix-helix protein